MGVKVVGLALLLATSAALGKERPAPLGDLATDLDTGTVRVRAVGAPGLNPPSAAIARVQAERAARNHAARQLKQTIERHRGERIACATKTQLLGAVDRAVADGEILDAEWGSNGSVALTLRVRFAELRCKKPTPEHDR